MDQLLGDTVDRCGSYRTGIVSHHSRFQGIRDFEFTVQRSPHVHTDISPNTPLNEPSAGSPIKRNHWEWAREQTRVHNSRDKEALVSI